jgi:peroxiredoxin
VNNMSEGILVAVFAVQVLTLLGLCFFLYQLVRQQGRMLLRLDRLEDAIARAAHQTTTSGQSGPKGLPVGTPVQTFELPDLAGNSVSLSDFRGKRVLLLYWSADCGFCDLIAPDLARLEPELHMNNTQLLLVSYGDVESNRKLAEEHGINCPILLIEGSRKQKVLENEVFESCGTPSAYLLDEEGRIALPLAAGGDAVATLASEAATGRKKKTGLRTRPLTESRIEREGLKVGTLAPPFSLGDVYGRTVSLEQFRGRRVLLVFTDRNCGPCDELAPHLVRLHRQHQDNGLTIIMVGRGSAEENRRKAEEHGFEFPVILQQRWKLSKDYGTFATPAAFLISENGVIMRKVAKGADEIMTLAREGRATT